MAENGKNGGNSKWIRWVLGIIIITVLPFMGSTIWSNDKDSRTRDEKQDIRHYEAIAKVQVQNQETNVTLAEILIELKHIKENGSRPN